MGGSDDKSNLVDLTAEEHYVAHQLLIKMYPKHKGLAHAAEMMTRANEHQVRNNRSYGWIRRKYAQECSEKSKGEGNNNHGKKWCHNPLTKEQKPFYPNEIPDGWFLGRSITELRDCLYCGEEFRAVAYEERYRYCSDTCRQTAKSERQKGKKPGNTIDVSDAQIQELYSRYTSGERVADICGDYGMKERRAYYAIERVKENLGM